MLALLGHGNWEVVPETMVGRYTRHHQAHLGQVAESEKVEHVGNTHTPACGPEFNLPEPQNPGMASWAYHPSAGETEMLTDQPV